MWALSVSYVNYMYDEMSCHNLSTRQLLVQGPNGHLHERDFRLPLLKKSSAEVLNI